MRWSPGDAVVLREIWHGKVWDARPATVVRDDPEMRMFYVPPGNGVQIAVDLEGRPLRLPLGDWRLQEVRWHNWHVLSFVFPNTPYAVLAFVGAETDRFLGWYVNLEDPPRPSPVGFDTTDHVLDVLIPPDRSTRTWKDEDELEKAVAAGLFSAEDAARFRVEGERAARSIIERTPPFDEPWEDWRPGPSWPPPEFPDGWDRVDQG
jgi:predicted RNA-binding protein associated with RNAse of E/G family